ncbi:2-dehydro-3-deoxy-D-gluconate 5-dehydrogenase KduD [Comamonas sp.]|uniref:2-dehydro-3-deoxy-D-gluconate 5-dehydrogenase KduD n=1 Tax=Comamonas sp. TaxID=34028 RepID=UPI0028AEE997|nr:2-dehydro-3-deoxy-D-gluconate 5-dehydrogenase KduD [Comamonas sp.]
MNTAASPASPFSLQGKVAIVTGCGGGLGQGIAQGLAHAGCDVVGVDLKDITETQHLVESEGRRFLGLSNDISQLPEIDAVIAQAVQAFGHIDVLVNNAGAIRRGDALSFSQADWDEVMDLNIRTVFFFCQAAAKQFIAQKTGGKIINIASMLSFQGGIQVPSYTASKSAVMGLTRLLANEWAGMNINVNALAPGYMATPMSADLRSDTARNQAIVERIPAGRWGTPHDMAGPAVFLASSAADYVQGYTIAVDGGWLSR